MIIEGEAAMLALGAQLAGTLKPGNLVAISGSLGAGKTVMCRGILHALGYAGEVSSPSYAIIHDYDAPGMLMPVVHADLYRLKNPQELAELGLFDGDERLLLVEWLEQGGAAFERADIRITIKMLGDDRREVTIEDKRITV
jgi:tRNA threonylcarbamoyladenosine biosynthesis protein TsaE